MQQIPISMSDAVVDALRHKEAIVAFETAIVTHGMPYPDNVALSLQCKALCTAAHVVPAVIALIDGTIVIGCSDDQVEMLAQQKKTLKVGKREIAIAIQSKMSGGTTVSATVALAQLAGIPLFVTGGIGGVHRNGAHTLDISADLPALAQHAVGVVCAGAKAILDIGRTLEYLETHAVPIVGYRSDFFPLFFSQHSGYPVQLNIETPDAIANLLRLHIKMGNKSGVVIANPCPTADAVDRAVIDEIIGQVDTEIVQNSISGQDVTPYYLQRINALTAGKSLHANKALLLSNCALGITVAQAYAALLQK